MVARGEGGGKTIQTQIRWLATHATVANVLPENFCIPEWTILVTLVSFYKKVSSSFLQFLKPVRCHSKKLSTDI